MGYDLVVCNVLLLVIYPLYVLVSHYFEKLARILAFVSVVLMAIFHFFILKYFLYQLVPLDTALFQYSLNEIFFTVTTTDVGLKKAIFLLLGLLMFISTVYYYLSHTKWNRKLIVVVYFLLVLSLPICGILKLTVKQPFNRFTQNKSFYFYSHSITRLFGGNANNAEYTKEDVFNFQQIDASKEYLSDSCPLLHLMDTTNVMKPYFNRFERSPNVVVLIVEGLNDDFIHPFKGVNLMPFLNHLKDNSLYWSRCFTLGERSFAVVPSLTGGLPYGEKGFTLLDKLPLHLSLVSILKANDYYTSFFNGQASWFHK